jgi:ABC-type xylose transport system permease subunit
MTQTSDLALETAPSTKKPSALAKIDWRAYRSVIALVVIVAALAILTQGTFVTPRNLPNLARQVAINGILAVGMTYVILIGGIDLSVGSVVALAGIVAGICQVNLGLAQWVGAGAWAATALSVLAAMAVGLAAAEIEVEAMLALVGAVAPIRVEATLIPAPLRRGGNIQIGSWRPRTAT